MIVVRQGQGAKCRGGNFCRYQRIYRENMWVLFEKTLSKFDLFGNCGQFERDV